MREPGKILLATQHYPPDSSTTATYIAAIAQALAADTRVVVLSGTAKSADLASGGRAPVEVIEVPALSFAKGSLVRRAVAISLLALRMFIATLSHAQRNDVVFCVTTPFTLPYAVVLAARLRGAATVLLIYDLYPEALVAAGLLTPTSPLARLTRVANGILFRKLDLIITIGRDVERLLLAYRGVTAAKIGFIPNWTLLPLGYREPSADNRFRLGRPDRLIVGLSGNLGFTHDPQTVFEAARLLRDDDGIHFMLSGWGVGWQLLRDMQAEARLPNVTLQNPVPETELVEFLSAGDLWVIPYRRNIAGVSIPSRLYNLLAVGRAIIVAAETHSEAALVVEEEQIGWVVAPENPQALAHAIRRAADDRGATLQMGRRAAEAARQYDDDHALRRYRDAILRLKSTLPQATT